MPIEQFIDTHSSELTILLLFSILILSLIIIVPQLLRAHLRKVEMQHNERMRALESGILLPAGDDRAYAAGRVALLVPMVVMISAGAVTCFVVAYKSDYLFPVTLSVWVVGGVVSLAAITGGVALLGRLAQLQEEEDDEMPRKPLDDRS